MAGRPIYRAMVDALNRAAVEAEQDSPLALAAQWIENGDTLTELAAYLSTFATRHDTGAKVTVTRSHLSRYLHETFGEEATKHLNAARKQEGAHAMAERALTDIADVDNDRDAIAKAKLQSDRRFKLAESYNREQYGQSKQQVDVNVNVGALFLDSLRKREVSYTETAPDLAALRAGAVEALNEGVQRPALAEVLATLPEEAGMSALWDEITAGARITLPPHTHEAVSGFAHMARNGQGAEPDAVAEVHEERWPEGAIARAEQRRKEQEGQ